MTISEVSEGPQRKRIGFVRVLPDYARSAFENRGYQCDLLDEAALGEPGWADTTDSVVLTQMAEAPYQVRKDLERFANLLNCDCRIYVRYAPNADAKDIVLRTLNRLKLPPSGFAEADAKLFSDDWFEGINAPKFSPSVFILQASDDWNLLANRIASNPAGRRPNVNLTIEVRDNKRQQIPLSRKPEEIEERELLLKRAFSDCSSLQLFQKTNGLSGVDAFDAFAYVDRSVVGTIHWPSRYFVKVGPRIKVAREFEKYRGIALGSVPYHLGPRVHADKCVLGRSQGLIVCDYVIGAEVLRDCAREGRGALPIGNLFNQTLIAWRRAATEESRPIQQYLADLLSKCVVPKHREPFVRAYGAQKTSEELKGLIAAALPSQQVLVGTVHGDLHATNVLVRMNDAVVIDFERIEQGQPLLLDAASLEGGLFVDGFIKDPRPAEEVLASIASLYTAKSFRSNDDHHCAPSDGSAWFVDSVRQIRMQARQMERGPHQYAWTLAAVLLKKACNEEDFSEDGESADTVASALTRQAVRALAYILAERVIVELSGEEASRPV